MAKGMGSTLKTAIAGIVVICILITSLLVGSLLTIKSRELETTNLEANPTVQVWRSKKEVVEEYALEDVVAGVVSAEMPASFELEALKAQAVAARTYIVKRLPAPWGDGASVHQQGAMLCDDFNHCQAFQDELERKDKWGDKFDVNEAKIQRAVAETAGQILTYDGQLISPTFHSTCGGMTEAAGDYWQNDVPALQAVPCFWDSAAPRYLSKVFFTKEELSKKLGVKAEELGQLAITKRSDAGRVMTVSCGEKEWKGSAFRSLLGLNSTDFTWLSTDEGYFFTVQGFGHGVGMCQYGANGMAQDKKSYEDILTHYYTGVEITPLADYLKAKGANTNEIKQDENTNQENDKSSGEPTAAT